MTAEKSRTIGLSMQELADYSTPYAAFMPTRFFAIQAQRAGADGLEFLPLRLPDLEVRKGYLRSEVLTHIVSGHQTFKNEKNVKDIFKNKGLKRLGIAFANYFVSTHQDSSLKTLRTLREMTGRNIPIVAYPPANDGPAVLYSTLQPSEELQNTPNRIFQPNMRHIEEWKNNPQLIKSYLDQYGWGGFCLDLFHMREESSDNPPAWRDYLPPLLQFTKEIHVAAGRIDSPQRKIDTVEELKQLYAGKGNCELLQIMRYIGESNWQGLVVTETPTMALRSVAKIKFPFLWYTTTIKLHSRIAENTKELINIS